MWCLGCRHGPLRNANSKALVRGREGMKLPKIDLRRLEERVATIWDKPAPSGIQFEAASKLVILHKLHADLRPKEETKLPRGALKVEKSIRQDDGGDKKQAKLHSKLEHEDRPSIVAANLLQIEIKHPN